MDRRFLLFAFVAMMVFLLTGCMNHGEVVYDDPVKPGQPESTEKDFNKFDFSTVSPSVTVTVNYNLPTKAGVYFELYDQDPTVDIADGASFTMKEGVEPLYAGMTDANGHFSQEMTLPAYVKTLYAFSPSFFAPKVISGSLNGNAVTCSFDYQDYVNASRVKVRSVMETANEHDTKMLIGTGNNYPDAPWKNWLVTYDKKKGGHVTNLYTGTELKVENSTELYTAHQAVINVNKKCPEEYRSSADFYIKEDSEVALTFLGGYTCWNSSLGYYYYKDGEKPSDLVGNVVLVFPNTQVGAIKQGNWNSYPQAGINEGDCVQLKYYPNIASGSQEGATTVFPAGYRIGLVLATNAWTNRVATNYGKLDKRYRSATSNGLSVDNNGKAYTTPRTAAYRYGNYVMVSFEDHIDDQNFSDVVVTLKSNPVKAIEVPEIPGGDIITEVKSLRGVYCFEDLWPEKGDYDMNDVLTKVTYAKSIDQNNKIYSESHIFQSFENFATKNNGLAVRVSGLAQEDQLKLYRRKSGETEYKEIDINYVPDEKVVYITSDVKQYKNAEYKLTVFHRGTVSKEKISVIPFLYRQDPDGQWEVHIPQDKPTKKINTKLFGKGDDATNVSTGVYFVRDGNYPFAIFLAGATEADLKGLLDRANEGKPIDELYPNYAKWATSGGKNGIDWYK